MLECSSLVFRFPGAERDIRADFRVDAGESVALMGASGSGKTTILNLVAGFLAPSSGDILLDGRSLLGLKPAERPLTYLFQAHNLFPHLSVWENIALGISPRLRIAPAEAARITAALERVGLTGMEERLPGSLSGGQQQRVGLGRCLVRERPVLLLDEPFSALDEELRQEMIALILALQAEHSLHLVLATHQRDDAAALSARIVAVG